MLARFFTGDLDSAKLKADIKNNPASVICKNFGYLGGRVYFIKPDNNNAKSIELLLRLLDQQQKGRISASAASWFVGGGNFISGRTDQYAQVHHNLFIQSLKRPTDYIRFTKSALSRYLDNSNEICLRDLTIDPIRHALATGMFDTDGMTPEFAHAMRGFSEILQEMSDNFALSIFLHLIASYYTSLLNYKSQFTRARNQYVEAIDAFISSQKTRIMGDLRRFAKGEKITNILSLSVIQLIKETKPDLADDRDALNDFLNELTEVELVNYLSDSYIRTVPGSIAAGDNTMIILNCGILAMIENESIAGELRQALIDAGINNLSTAEEIEAAINNDKENGGIIERFYLECLRRESLLKKADHLSFETMSFRHTDIPLEFDGFTIEANSMIAVLSGMPRFDERIWENPSVFNPSRFFSADGKSIDSNKARMARMIFSTGSRMCPANHVTEYIVKTYMIYMSMNFQLQLINNNNIVLESIMDPSKLRVRLIPVEQASIHDKQNTGLSLSAA